VTPAAGTLRAALPLYATERDEAWRSYGPAVERVSVCLGLHPMPWQQQTLGVGLEYGRDGRPRYKLVVVSVCRQCGKTTGVIAPLILHRLILWPRRAGPQVIIYGAQTLKDGRDKWRDEIWPAIVQSGLASEFGLRPAWSLADPAIRCAATGSVMRITGMAEAAGHGSTVSMVVLDEAWRLADASREQALLPAMATVSDSQFWVVSTAGHYDSVYFRRQVEAGRRRVKKGRSAADRAAFLEWGLPEGADWEDESLWPSAVPALGRTIDIETLRTYKRQMSPDDFRRAHLNQWPLIDSSAAVAWVDWEACRAGPGVAVTGEKLWLAADVPRRGEGGGGLVVAGSGTVGVVAKGVGQGWAAAEIRRFHQEYGRRLGGVGFLRGGALAATGETLEGEGVPVVWYDWAKLARACERMHEHVTDQKVAIQADRALDAAVRRAGARDRELGAWVWRPRKEGTSVSVLQAATMAYDLDVLWRTTPRSRVRVSDWEADEGYDAWLKRYIEEA